MFDDDDDDDGDSGDVGSAVREPPAFEDEPAALVAMSSKKKF